MSAIKGGRTAKRSARPFLRGLSDVYRFARTSPTPIYFVSPTAYNVLGIDQWVGAFEYITYFDSFDGHHPHVVRPRAARGRRTSSRSSRSTRTCWATRTWPIASMPAAAGRCCS